MKKFCILCWTVWGDGRYPCKELGNLTPLEAADTPTMDMLQGKGRQGLCTP